MSSLLCDRSICPSIPDMPGAATYHQPDAPSSSTSASHGAKTGPLAHGRARARTIKALRVPSIHPPPRAARADGFERRAARVDHAVVLAATERARKAARRWRRRRVEARRSARIARRRAARGPVWQALRPSQRPWTHAHHLAATRRVRCCHGHARIARAGRHIKELPGAEGGGDCGIANAIPAATRIHGAKVAAHTRERCRVVLACPVGAQGGAATEAPAVELCKRALGSARPPTRHSSSTACAVTMVAASEACWWRRERWRGNGQREQQSLQGRIK